MQPPSVAPPQPNREPYASDMQYASSASQYSSDPNRPEMPAYNRPPAMPDYRQQARHSEPSQPGVSYQPAAPHYNYQPSGTPDQQRGYELRPEYSRGNTDSARGYVDSSRAYGDGGRPKAAAANRDFANSSIQTLSPQSPSAAEAKKAAYRYGSSPCMLCVNIIATIYMCPSSNCMIVVLKHIRWRCKGVLPNNICCCCTVNQVQSTRLVL